MLAGGYNAKKDITLMSIKLTNTFFMINKTTNLPFLRLIKLIISQ